MNGFPESKILEPQLTDMPDYRRLNLLFVAAVVVLVLPTYIESIPSIP